MIALRRSVVPLVIVLVILVALFYAVFPTRTFMDQSAALAEVQAKLDALHEENDALRNRMEVLTQPEEIERLARSEYNLVYPGEEAYAMLPPARNRWRFPTCGPSTPW